MNRSPTDPPTDPPRPFWSRHLRREVQFLLDLSALTGAFWLAYLLRFDFGIPAEIVHRALVQLPFVVLLQFAALVFLGAYQFVWRYIGMSEIRTFLRAAIGTSVPLVIMRLGLPERFEVWRVPLSVIVIDTALAFGMVLGLRVLRRALYERFERVRRRATGPRRLHRALLVGAGRAGQLATREVLGRGDLNLISVGFVDDDPRKQGAVIQGIKVIGTIDEIPRLAVEEKLDRVVITIAEPGSEMVRRIFNLCDRAGVRVQIIPGLYEILQGKVSISRFRDVQIEDLLGREPVRLDEEAVRRLVSGKCVMVTGAGGSIGSELSRQLARFRPSSLLLVERAEGPLFEVHRELRELWPELPIEPLIADVGDPHRMRHICESRQPRVVLHAAAHKHVPMMESNPTEAVRNNVLATHQLGRIAGESGLEAFVLISTDKAVRPSSVMGASKRAAELVIQDLDRQFAGTRYLAVRFGNVLGSAGSVVPIFREQIRRGGPVTVTHPEARRFFMTIPEAAQLVLQAGAIGSGGEILILDMGKPLKILDLAVDMITLSGYRPYEEIPIVFTGLRPGEKLSEDLELSSEKVDRTLHPKIFVGRLASCPTDLIEEALTRFGALLRSGAPDGELRDLLADLIPEANLGAPVQVPPASEMLTESEQVH